MFRYEFEAELETAGDLPAAHVQFHGDNKELAEMIRATSRGRPRGRQSDPDVSRVHFPVGGSRFRPCLEDVLEMLITEFEVDPQPNKGAALDELAVGRMEWRDMQLRAAIRDNPGTAVDMVRELGYQVTWPDNAGGNPPVARKDYLRRL